jgi:1-acyl-sn-glycerol-3-phosphate acyltransferase
LHALRVARTNWTPPSGSPVIVCMNHPSWWDPLIALTLGYRMMPARTHYGPIEAAALARYRFFERLGFFGIKPDSACGAARFLRIGESILQDSSSALWITAQGTFADTRQRPTELRKGIGHLVHRLNGVTVLPLALEIGFWEERFPEALARFGEPMFVDNGGARSPSEWTALIAQQLERAQNDLARASIARDRLSFDVLLGGRTGVGGIYDSWRAAKAWARGRRFSSAHGTERV